jgi:hypothetical protein
MTALEAAPNPLAALFLRKCFSRRTHGRGSIFDNNRVLQEEPTIFMAYGVKVSPYSGIFSV